MFIHHSTNQHLGALLQIESDYPNFDQLFSLKINSDFYLGITLALNWLKVFKYLKLNSTLLLLNKTMSTCAHQVVAFACIFFIIFLAYTQLGWLLFGGHLSEWRSFQTSMSVEIDSPFVSICQFFDSVLLSSGWFWAISICTHWSALDASLDRCFYSLTFILYTSCFWTCSWRLSTKPIRESKPIRHFEPGKSNCSSAVCPERNQRTQKWDDDQCIW